jgi:hypothetical protein
VIRLTKGREAPDFTSADLLDQLTGKKGSTLWLGRYTEEDVLHLLDKFGILSALKEKGFNDLIIAIEPVEPFVQALKIFFSEKSADHLLAEFRLREMLFSHRIQIVDAPLKMLAIEWLMLQNPLAQFTPERPRLPGQRHPGLGQGRRVVNLLVHLAEQHHLAGILNFPEYFHNACLYLEYFHFCDPRLEGIVQALRRDIRDLSLAELSWAVYLGCVIDAKSGKTFEWQAEALVLPLDERIQKYFTSAEYQQLVNETLGSSSFILDQQRFHVGNFCQQIP